jgi:hypothetical protein
MSVSQLLRWQWEGYARYHQSRANLLLHVLTVPLFLAGNISLVAALIHGFWPLAFFSIVAMIASVALQGRGHSKEVVPPEPFTGPFNAVSRIFLEQWVTFPRFVLSGRWSTALRHAPAPSQETPSK